MYLLFSDMNHIGPFIIRIFTRSKWSHVDIVLGEDLSDLSTPIVGATTKGVIRYTLGERLSQAKRASAIKIVPHGLVKDQVEWARRTAIEWLNKQVGKSYDWGAIFFAIGLNRNWRADDKWFCSEIAADFALRCGMPVIDPDFGHRVTPQDIYNLPFPKILVK